MLFEPNTLLFDSEKKTKSIFVLKAFICATASYEGKVKLLLIVELQKGISA